LRITKVLFQVMSIDESGKWELADKESAAESTTELQEVA